ncbi:MAG TPA: uroporphyrinogen decarboxylase [Acidobacteriota bacterium]|jgi:uroporphyrinogen decarboxylase|nr:uroporphyrinogen decarboxylase [Acidobacteriota bacterium]
MKNERLLLACRRQRTDKIPVWFMRQAGRYLPEYRALREKHSILEICKTPELACEATLQPLARFDVDAAILFADLLLPLEPMGLHFDFLENEGPVISNPLEWDKGIDRLQSFHPEEALSFVLEAIRLTVRELKGKLPLIGFAGAPFTLASYMIEGRSSRSFEKTKQFMYHQTQAWHRLMDFLVQHQARFLRAQICAGAAVVQVFDSWLGALGPEDFRIYVRSHSAALLQELSQTGTPVIHFATGIAGYLEDFADCGGDVVGVDWRIDLGRARRVLRNQAVQGNLDPVWLLAPKQGVLLQTQKTLEQAGGEPGYIFNLGHGILPGTPVENVQAVVELVHSHFCT